MEAVCYVLSDIVEQLLFAHAKFIRLLILSKDIDIYSKKDIDMFDVPCF